MRYTLIQATIPAMKKRLKRFSSALLITLAALGLYSVLSYETPVRLHQSEKHTFKIITIANNLHHPWAVAFLPGGEFLVTERRGKLWRISPDGKRQEISGVPAVYHSGQGGLLDVLVPEGFQDKDWIYLSYAAPDSANPDAAGTEVSRARLSLRDNRLVGVERIFEALPKIESDHHFGSRLVLARDNTLYITLGERGQMEEAQNPTNHFGKIVRINPDGTIPQDNPFISSPTIPHDIYSIGIRSPQGMALHPETGQIWENEHGPQGGDEINILKSGANYGWPAVTFGVNYVTGTQISDKTSAPTMEDSLWHWIPSIAPSGMMFYTGDKFPGWKGNLFVGALKDKKIARLELDGEKIVRQEYLIQSFNRRIRDVRNAPDGYIYFVTDEDNGELARLEPLP